MAAARSVLALLLLLTAASGAAAARAPASAAPADTVQASPRVVRLFPPVEVRGLLHDWRSSQTVRMISGPALHELPVDDFAGVLALQPGVVVQGEELHVRGGRSGETTTYLDGICLNEPQRQRAPLGLPLLALSSADLVSGSPEARYGCGLAGALDLRTADPGPRPSFAWRWQTALADRWYDRLAARVETPLRVLGLGLIAAGDAALDDTWLPALRSTREQRVAGVSFDWRAENRMVGLVKLAPVEQPQRFSLQVLVSRHLQRPYDPAWTLDGWTYLPPDPRISPIFSPAPLPGYRRYRAADHSAATDERRIATIVSLSRLRAAGRATMSLGWLRTRTVTSRTGRPGMQSIGPPAVFGADGYHVLWGDYPLYRESGSDVLTLRGDGEATTRVGGVIRAGAGITYEDVSLFELDNSLSGIPVDQLRTYHAYAPGGFAYAQGRWEAGGLVMNSGLRAEYFTAGPEAAHQTQPWDGRGIVSLSPRFGFAYPVSVRDAFSLAYSRIQQAPGRDYLYDQRQAISNRQPLGNPALRPATAVSYEAAVKHTFNLAWALQASVFYRDVYGQVGMRNFSQHGIPDALHYVSEDDGHATGFELSLIHVAGERRRIEVHYTFMEAWGLESRPEGDPYGAVIDERATPIGTAPLSWDRRHSVMLAGIWPWRKHYSLSWSTAVGSPLPWTPKPRRELITDLALVNSRRLGWTENTNVNAQWTPRFAHGLTISLEARNLFDNRSERGATVDGYPNPVINTLYDDYSAYRTETGQGGGAYWVSTGGESGYWVPVHDSRLLNPPRTVRLSVGANW
jgi:outer membrane receptor protein involved in Fe transport